MAREGIIFDTEIYKNVAKKTGLHEDLVKIIFNQYLQSVKEFIEETDDIRYRIPHLGFMIISLKQANRELNKYRRRIYRTKNKAERERLKKVEKNYRVRIHRLKNYLLKLRRMRGYRPPHKIRKLYKLKHKYETFDDVMSTMTSNMTFEEAVEKQNIYAKKFNKDEGSRKIT